MNDKEKVVQEEINKDVQDETVKVDLDEPYNPLGIEFETLSDEDKLDNWNKLKDSYFQIIGGLQGVQQAMVELEAKAQGKVSEDAYKRLMADYDNYKRRTSTSRSEGYADGQVEVLTQLVDIVDNFERAMAMITDEKVLSGIQMIYKQFTASLEKFKVTEIEALGKAFDPNLMNAVMQGEASKPEEVDAVLEVFQKGYMYGEKVLRYAFVKVGR